MLSLFAEWTESFELVPGAHGVFDLTVNDDVVFSKLKEKRYPELRELTDPVRKLLD